MADKGKVFLVGAGFIGTEVLHHLLQEGYHVTTLARRKEHASELEKLGVKSVMGTLDDQSIIQSHAAASDIVIHTATADHLPSVQAILQALDQRAKKGLSTIYIHTSGTSELSDDSKGNFKGDKIFSDDNPEAIDALPDTASHREIDLAILKARKELGTKSKSVIILPPLIYGKGPHSGRISIQIPTLTRFAIKHGFAAHIGKGESVWSHIHVSDLARAYMVILHWMEKTSPESVLENPYWFCENGTEHSWGEVASEIGRALHKAGKVSSPEPKTVPEDLYDDLFGMYSAWVVGSNSRSRANRLRELGWKPTEKDTFKSLHEDEMLILLAEKGTFSGYAGVAASGSG